MNPRQCPICAEHWINEGRPLGNYLIVSRGGHIPGVYHGDPTPEAAAAAVPEQRTESVDAAAQCTICKAYWSNEGRPRDHYLILSRGGHIPGVHGDPAREPGTAAVEEHAAESRVAQCPECADYWIREGRPMDHYLIVSRGDHIPGVHRGSSSPHQTSPEAAGPSQVPDSNSELRDEINILKYKVIQLESRLSRIDTRREVPGLDDFGPEMESLS